MSDDLILGRAVQDAVVGEEHGGDGVRGRLVAVVEHMSPGNGEAIRRRQLMKIRAWLVIQPLVERTRESRVQQMLVPRAALEPAEQSDDGG